MNKEKWLEEQRLNKLKISCDNCKFYNRSEYVCSRNYNYTSILNEDETGVDCEYFTFGEYDENDLEDLRTVGFHQY